MAEAASDDQKSIFYTKGKCLCDCEVMLIVGEEETQLFFCKEQLAKASQYFRVMFFENFKEKIQEQFQITDETPKDMICFFNSIDPNPEIAGTVSDLKTHFVLE